MTEEQITKLMVGRELSEMFPERSHGDGDVVLSVQGMTTNQVTIISFELRLESCWA